MPRPPDDLWSDLERTVPVALAPVRLETRYGTRPATSDDGRPLEVPVLRVRIYPDTLSVVDSPAALTAVEKEAGADFWSAQQDPETPEEHALPGALEHRRRAAWEVLSRRVGAARTPYVANATRPGAPAPPDEPSQAATARLLPDDWVVTGYLDGQQVFAEHVSRPAGDLQVGPSRDAERPAFEPGDPHLVHAEDGLRWMTDFDAAVAAGMAAVIDLADEASVAAGAPAPAVVDRGLDLLVVVGARPPVDAERTADTEATAFADLIAAHATADRVAFLAQGTPTNNLTDRSSGYTTATDVYAGYDRVTSPPAPAVAADGPALGGESTDGAAFESALGLAAGTTSGLDGADRREQWLARNMALALFPATLGEVIGTLARPGSATGQIDAAAVERYIDQLDNVMPFVREHLGSFVRARGTLPVLRVGRQPYGVLPILPGAQWRAAPDEPAQLSRLQEILGVLRRFFEQASGRVPVLHSDADATTQLVGILGLAPVPHPGGYAVGSVTGPAAMPFERSGPNLVPIEGSAGHVAQTLAASAGVSAAVALQAYRHLIGLTVGDLVDGTQLEWLTLNGVESMRVPVARTDPGRAGWESPSTYLQRLTDELVAFRLIEPGHDEVRPRDLLFLLAQHSLALAGELDSLRLLKALNDDAFAAAVSVPTELQQTPVSVAEPFSTAFTASVSHLAASPEIAASLPARSIPEVVSDHAALVQVTTDLNLPHAHVNGFAGTRDAVGALAAAALSDDDYTRLTSETLACAATRLDAWYTSLAAQRLATHRTISPTGVQVGAWGVLVNVRRQQSRAVAENDVPATWADSAGAAVAHDALVQPVPQVGYVHAPSLAQARTAGVLRAAERAHAGDGSSLASLDLTSRRVRVARDVVDAMGNGQPLGALLGYRLERMLADRSMYAEIAALRKAFPQRRVDGELGTPAGSDDVVPDEVVDGLEVSKASEETIAQVCQGTAAQVRAVIAELDVVVEAVADLLVAEGVHQITSGRPETGGATFAAVAGGTPPPASDVTRQPGSGVTITHRTLLVLDPAGGTAGWNRNAPRALLAPEAERWAEGVLGAATAWKLTVGDAEVSLKDLKVCALDVLVEAQALGGADPVLTDRLTAHGGGSAPVVDDTYGRLLALALTAYQVLAASRPAVAADLAPPPQADQPDAGTVLATAPPSEAMLGPLVERISTQLDALVAGIAEVNDAAAAAGAVESTQVPADLLTPFQALGLPGSMQSGDTVGLGVLVAAASAAAATLRDVDQMLATGLPVSVAPTATRRERLEAQAGSPAALDTLVRTIRRLGGQAVVPTIEVPSHLHESEVEAGHPDAVEGWLSQMSRVRTTLGALDDLRLFLEAEGTDPEPLLAFQLPLVPAEGWVGGTLAAAPRDPHPAQADRPVNELRGWVRPTGPRFHVVTAGPAAQVAEPQVRALVVDEVSEVLPSPTVSTGVALYYDAPSARPPQTILLAVNPDLAAGWSWQVLEATAQEALALARLRGVELDDLADTGIDEYLPLTYVRDGVDGTSPMSELTAVAPFLVEAIAANRYVRAQP